MEKLESLIAMAVPYVVSLAGALLTLIIGLFVVKIIVKIIGRRMEKSSTDASLAKFLKSLIRAILIAMLVVAVAGMVGIETSSFVAILGAAGLAVGLALQGSLSNFAGGVLILIFRPFKVGDVINAQGVVGAVEEIQIFNTILRTVDKQVIIVPNGPLSNGIITNITTSETRLVEWTFGIGYADDIDKAKAIIKDVVFSDSRVLNQNEPFINLSELADSSVNFKVRAEVKGSDYWGVFFDTNEKIKKAFDKEGVNIPFPQMDVHLNKVN